MSTTMQLSELRTAVLQRADMVNSQFVQTAELNSYINQSAFELYDLLVQKYGDNYYIAPPVQFTTDGTSQLYNLPNGTLYSSAPALFKLIGVDCKIGPAQNSFITLKPFNLSERNRYSQVYTHTPIGRYDLRYKISGNQIWFNSIPPAGLTIQLWYVPRMTTLSLDTDTFDGISGWTEFVIVDSAIKCLQKEESDVSVLLSQKAALIARIEAAAENRDAGMPATVSDTSGSGWSDEGWI